MSSIKMKSGMKFKSLVKQLMHKHSKNPKALAAWIGRKKYGPKKFEELALKGKQHKHPHHKTRK
jgi:hypothetical protein